MVKEKKSAIVEDVLDNVEIIEDKDEILETVDSPTSDDKNWTEYVLSLMYEDELIDGHPKVDGLRRIVEKIVGQITEIDTTVLQCPGPENNYHATVQAKITVNNVETISASADVGANNTEATYARHPVATAETRAEARAYRKLLRLRNIIAAEENVKLSEIVDASDIITHAQLSLINNQCAKLDLDIDTWLETQDVKLANLANISKAKAMQLCEVLTGLRQTKAGEVK